MSVLEGETCHMPYSIMESAYIEANAELGRLTLELADMDIKMNRLKAIIFHLENLVKKEII